MTQRGKGKVVDGGGWGQSVTERGEVVDGGGWGWGCNTVGLVSGALVLEGQVLFPGPARDFSSSINF